MHLPDYKSLELTLQSLIMLDEETQAWDLVAGIKRQIEQTGGARRHDALLEWGVYLQRLHTNLDPGYSETSNLIRITLGEMHARVLLVAEQVGMDKLSRQQPLHGPGDELGGPPLHA